VEKPAHSPGSRPAIHPVARLPEEWAESLARRGERSFRAREVFRWIHAKGALDADAMSTLPKTLRGTLATEGLKRKPADDATDPVGVGEVERIHRSDDGTRKLLVRMPDGAPIETVLIPGVSGPRAFGAPAEAAELDADADADADAQAADEDDDDGDASGHAVANVAKRRVTQCISTQVGCAMGCVFCASGVAGLKRHLPAEQIVGQVLLGRALLDPDETLRNVVYMGMGEPLHNYEATARSLRLLTHPEGIALSPRRVTVSTSGLVPEIARLGADFAGQINLAISLHAADDATRGALMPINKKYPLAVLLEGLRAYPLPKRRRITIEYTLVSGKNDEAVEAKKLARLLRGIPVKINLIPMNPIGGSTLGPPDMGRVLAFQQILCDAGYACFVRRRRGDDVSAACGQLALEGAKPKVRTHLRTTS
jgi:23S rRNA (adenine2503-C2)-methyltransferase